MRIELASVLPDVCMPTYAVGAGALFDEHIVGSLGFARLLSHRLRDPALTLSTDFWGTRDGHACVIEREEKEGAQTVPVYDTPS